MKLLPLLLLAPIAAHAWQFEAGVSSTNYGMLGSGTWFQEGLPNVLNTKTYGFSAGFTGELYSRGTWGVDYHVDYVNLGHVSAVCDCTTDENYNNKTHTQIDPSVPTAHFVGNGNSQGVSFTIEPWVRYQGFRFGFEAGMFPYRPAWSEVVTDVTRWGGAPQTLYANTPHAVQLGEVVGVNVGIGNMTLGLVHYFLPTKFDASHSPAIWKGATVVQMKYKF